MYLVMKGEFLMKHLRQTKNIDDIVCPYCGYKFDGQTALNGDMDCMSTVNCPNCNDEMTIMISVEYTATEIKD